jgi:diketogulonate reductase-like aldo/keto reductase
MVHVAPLLDLHKKYNIITQAYGALAPTTGHPTGGPLIPILERIAANLSKETGVEVDTSGVLMLWVITTGGVCITSSGSEERIKKMADLEKVRSLNEGEMKEIQEAGSRIHFRQRVSSLCETCRSELNITAGTSRH